MKTVLVCLILTIAAPCFGQVVVPTRTIRADAIIVDQDVRLEDATTDNSFQRLQDVVGQEAHVVLYAGRPIMPDQVGPPAIISRNQIVVLFFKANGLRIMTEARALERGAVGDSVRVMNLASRATLFGQVQPNGTIEVKN